MVVLQFEKEQVFPF